ncbi:MAG: type II toxin-antitoxin system RelE family toxin, partial [Nitrososphaera sp.]
PEDIRRKILDACRSMSDDPFDGDVKPLKGITGAFRRRVGNYRIAFSVNFNENEVLILKIGRRGKFYEGI